MAILLTEKYASNSYAVIAALISVMALIFGFICIKSLKGVYNPKPVAQGNTHITLRDTFKAFFTVFSSRAAKIFLVFVFFFLTGSSMIQSNLTYMVVDCVGMEYDTGIVYVIISLVISMVIVVPVVEKVAIKKDRRFACLTFLSATLVGLVIC